MKLTSVQKVIKLAAISRAQIGLKLDLIELAKQSKDWQTIKALKDELKGYRNFALHLLGEKGLGKTDGTIEAATMAGYPCIVLYPSQWVDSADAVGMPRVRLHNGKEVTVNVVRDFFPQPKLDEEGNQMLRKDGGIMYDYEAISEYIANYEEMLVQYEGDVNQAPGCIVFWDEFNRIVAQDVQALMFNVILKQTLGHYKFPNGTFMVGASNPNTADYNVTSFLEDEAIKDRFFHIEVDGDMGSWNEYAYRNGFHWSVIDLANAHERTVVPKGEEYEFTINSSGRSMHALSSLLKFTNIADELEEADFMELVAGGVGREFAAHHAEILRNGLTKIPNGEEIIRDYENVRNVVVTARENNNQDVMNQIKEKFMVVIMDPANIEKLNLQPKMNGKEVIVPEGLENIYRFFSDISPEFRVAMVKEMVKNEEIHPVIAMHEELYLMVKNDVKNSNRKN